MTLTSFLYFLSLTTKYKKNQKKKKQQIYHMLQLLHKESIKIYIIVRLIQLIMMKFMSY